MLPKKMSFFLVLLIASTATSMSVNAQYATCLTDGSCATNQVSGSCGGWSEKIKTCGKPGGLFGSKTCGNSCRLQSSQPCDSRSYQSCGQGNACGDCEACSTECGTDRPGIGKATGVLGEFRSLMRFGNRIRYPGEYLSVFGGWSDVHDYFGNPPIQGTFNDGFLVGYTRGRRINCNTRIERESAWRNNSIAAFNDGAGFAPLAGRLNNFATMFNVVRDFGRGKSPVSPYLGAGIGISKMDGEFFVPGGGVEVDDFTFAYQAIVGLSVKRSECVDLYCEYRYFANTDVGVEVFGGPELGDFEFLSESVVFGFRMKR